MRKLVLSALFLYAHPMVSMGEVEGQWTYSVENGEATIKSSTATGAVTIPSELGGNSVRKMGHLATIFGPGNTSVSSITIPNGVTTIGSYTFKDCLSLTSVIIPTSVTSIGANAFSFCSSLTNVTIPNSVNSIGEKAFYSCTNLASVTIGSGVKSMPLDALDN